MLAKAKKHADRAGLKPVHVQCVVVVKTLHVPEDSCVPNESTLCITFSKGKKSASTNHFILNRPNKGETVVTTIKERLELTVVLYQDTKTRRFQTKDSKLVLRQLCKPGGDVLGKSCYKDIGRCNLELNEIANEMGSAQTKTKNGTVIFENLNGVMVKLSLTLTVETDEAPVGSSLAQVADASAGSACCCEDNPHEASTMPEEEDKSVDTSSASTLAIQSTLEAVSVGPQEVGTTSACRCLPAPCQPSPTSTDDAPPRESEGLIERVSGVTDSEQSSSHDSGPEKCGDSSRCDPTVPSGCEGVLALYEAELAARDARIADLEAVLADNHQVSEEQLERYQAELRALSATLAQERANRSAADTEADLAQLDLQEGELVQALLQARQEAAAATARYTATIADLEETTGDLERAREELSALYLQLREETSLTQQAARVASEACAERAEVEDENRQLVAALVDMKVRSAAGRGKRTLAALTPAVSVVVVVYNRWPARRCLRTWTDCARKMRICSASFTATASAMVPARARSWLKWCSFLVGQDSSQCRDVPIRALFLSCCRVSNSFRIVT